MNNKTNTAATLSRPNRLKQAVALTVTLAMINAPLVPAQAAVAQKQQQDKAQDKAQAAQNKKDDAVTQMIELSAKHALNLDFIKEAEATRLATRSVVTKVVDGVKTLFVDTAEEKAIDSAQDALTNQLLGLEVQMHNEHTELMHELVAQAKDYQAKGMPLSVFDDQRQLVDELNKRHKQLTDLIGSLRQASSDTQKQQALKQLNQQLAEWQPKVAHTDMEHLPWVSRPHHGHPYHYHFKADFE